MMPLKKFELFMDSDTIDDECDHPSIDVEINICETVSDMDKGNDLSNKIDEDIAVYDNAQKNIEEAEMLIDVLKNNGVSPLAIKIISSNSLYTDVWKIHLPSAESLDIKSNNQKIADEIADMLRKKIELAYAGLEGLWSALGDSISAFWDWFTDLFRNNEEKVNRMADRVNNIELDEEKVNKRFVKYWDVKTIENYTNEAIDVITSADELIIDPSTGKITNELGSKIREFINRNKIKEIRKEKTKKPLAEVSDDIVMGRQGSLYKTVIQLNNVLKAYKACFDRINKAIEEAKKIEKDSDKHKNNELDDGIGVTSGIAPDVVIGAARIAYKLAKMVYNSYVTLAKFIENYGRKRAMRLMKDIVNNYLVLGSVTYDCRVR